MSVKVSTYLFKFFSVTDKCDDAKKAINVCVHVRQCAPLDIA